jgi:hypothetical protein
MANINQITPATDWFFIHPSESGETPIAHPIAAWALQPNGDVVGLIGNDPAIARGLPKLAMVPSVPGGAYKHISAMTDKERARIGLMD